MILTILLAMLDTSDFPEAFFYIRHVEEKSAILNFLIANKLFAALVHISKKLIFLSN
jgi:hypothetical protein